ncbi:DNA/RNA nuclease SfsA [Peredibacter starrii]|uniref:Sugar fermentation stimulation protein homolog n=1 Tax=Peredibacter starrii TaxID=28202 RepID=A0AAX4HLC3_9BACT|nr:DNA/RNA nuclease SfsA [Peredibacter starrii]WPU63933.1 DNA/RNA nuclease SfsA [Peredibacter starrii]
MNVKWDKPLTEAVLLKRYKRFLADIQLGDDTFTAHVPNTGSMTSCWEPHWKCAISKSDNPARKMAHTLELTHNGETWIGVNTANANKLAHLWLKNGLISELTGYSVIQPEKKIGESRIDFYLEGHTTLPSCYVEVKNVTLKLDGIAQFPDAVSERGQKHLKELMQLKKEGHRAAMLYVVQREDVDQMKPAHGIDKVYGQLLAEAHAVGVEILVYQCKMGTSEIGFGKSLPFLLR